MQALRPPLSGARTRLIVATLVCLVSAGTASAATRYAGVGGTGVSPCALATPCPIATAISGAIANDTVHVLPGTHVVETSLFTANGASNVVIEGEGMGVSVISYQPQLPTSNAALILGGSTPTVRNLSVHGSANAFWLFAGFGVTTGPVFDHVSLRNLGAGEALIAVGEATVRDSVITAVAGPLAAGAVRLDGTMTGTTVVAQTGPAIAIDGDFSPGFAGSATIRNSIVRGGSSDIRVVDMASVITSHLDIDYSAYRQNGISTTGPVTQSIGTHNVFAAPLLVDLAGGTDVHQLTGSPTIDAGDPLSAVGSSGDLDGQQRIIGSAPDIGADEAPTTKPVAAMGAATNVTTTGATLNGTVNPAGLETTYHFEYGPTTAYGSSSPDVVVPAGLTNVAAAFDVANLAIGSTLHARLVAINSAGTATSADVTIPLASPPPAPTPVPVPPQVAPEDLLPVLGPLALVPASPKSGRVATVRFSLSEQARITLTLDRLVAGRRQGTTCRVGRTTGARCTKAVRRATLARTVAAGTASTFAIPAKPGGSKLLAGRYRVRVTARDLVTGKVSAARNLVIVVRA